MLKDSLGKIEKAIISAPKATDETKQELLRLVNEMKDELSDLGNTHTDNAQSIAGFTQVATHEATREASNPELTKHALNGLSEAANEFEATHPKLFSAVREFCRLLSQTGI